MNAATAIVPVNRPSRLVAAALVAFGTAVAQAQDFYKCVTPAGRRLGADRPPPECTGQRIEIFGPDGRYKGAIEPPLSPEQRRKLDDEEKRKRDEEEAQRDQKQRDRSLLSTYSSVEEIDAARKRSLTDYQVIVDRALVRIDELKRTRKKLDNEAEFYEKRQLPEHLKRDLAGNNEALKGQEKTIAATRAEMKRVNERFDADAKRLRELIERSGRAAPPPSANR